MPFLFLFFFLNNTNLFIRQAHVRLIFPLISVEYFQVSGYGPLPRLTFHGESQERGHVSFFTRVLCGFIADLMLLFVSCPELSDRLSLEPFFFCSKKNTDIFKQDCKNISQHRSFLSRYKYCLAFVNSKSSWYVW